MKKKRLLSNAASNPPGQKQSKAKQNERTTNQREIKTYINDERAKQQQKIVRTTTTTKISIVYSKCRCCSCSCEYHTACHT